MTWAEFQIRAFAYWRLEERNDLRAREIAWSALIGSHQDPKKLPKTKDKFWQIGSKNVDEPNAMQEAIKNAQEKYLKDKQLKEQNG